MSFEFQLPPTQAAPQTMLKPEDDVTRFARVALVIGKLLTLALGMGVVSLGIAGRFSSLKAALFWLTLTLSLAWLFAAVMGVWWTFRFKVKRTEVLEAIEDEERYYRYQVPLPLTEPEPVYLEPETVRIEFFDGTGSKTHDRYYDLPCSRDALTKLANGLVNGIAFSETSWTGKGKPFTRGENGTFIQLRDALLARGLIQWRNTDVPTLGMEPTRAGWAAFRHLAPHPLNGDVSSKTGTS